MKLKRDPDPQFVCLPRMLVINNEFIMTVHEFQIHLIRELYHLVLPSSICLITEKSASNIERN